MSAAFTELLAGTVSQVESTLDALLPDPADSLIAHQMRYTTLNGGKRLRAFLVVHSASLFDVPEGAALRAAAAIECVHAYSLVHDDLPCMDDDDLRRGKPTVHVKWGDATAVLVGDALQTIAFEILADPATSPDPALRLQLISSLARAAGARGMVLGQAQDIAAETTATALTLKQITDLQANKTGALIRWAAEAGALLGQSDPAILSQFATALGLAFQIQDDILDIEGDAKTAGKRLQKDAEAGKATFVSVLGLAAAKSRAASLVTEACDVLAPYGSAADPLRQVAGFVIQRNM
ncbi:MAG: polyprenyl synthetase family protein [Rhodobacteraceae bacterium]|nr:polyprenyl synthetase family protein [Paracoccaceae bacterium]